MKKKQMALRLLATAENHAWHTSVQWPRVARLNCSKLITKLRKITKIKKTKRKLKPATPRDNRKRNSL